MASAARRIAAPLLLLLCIVPPSLEGASFVVPSDETLFADAAAVAVVKVLSFQPRFDAGGEIVTDVVLLVQESIKGDLAGEVRITEMGGIVGGQARAVSGVPDYFPGERALVFLERRGDQWRTRDMLLGKFSFVNGIDGELLVRGAAQQEVFGWDAFGKRHREVARKAAKFLSYLRGRAAGLDAPADYYLDTLPDPRHAEREDPSVLPESGGEKAPFDERPATGSASAPLAVIANTHYPPSAYTMGAFRWKIFDEGGTVSYRITGSQPGYDSVAVAQAALAAWTNEPDSNVRLALGSGAGGQFLKDGINSIVYNNSTDVPASAIGYAQIYSSGQHSYKGETFNSVVEGDVVMKSGLAIPATAFQEAVTHEVGHTIALRHSDQGTPSSTNAVMRSIVLGTWGATLAPWDREAVSHVYTGASTGNPPAAPGGVRAQAVASTTIRVTWNAVSGAERYDIERSSSGTNFIVIGSATGTAYNDTTAQAGRAYLYRVRAANDAGVSSPSSHDLATAILFTDDPIVARQTTIKAIHIEQLRTAVNAVRVLSGLGAASWTEPNLSGAFVKAVHVSQLRDRLNEARTRLGLPAISFSPALSAGAMIRAAHIEQLRDGVR